MSVDHRELRRLGEGGEPDASLEANAGAFLHDARPTIGLAESEIDAIARRLLRPRHPHPRLLVPVLVALAVLLATGTVMAIVGGWRPRWPTLGSSAAPAAPAAAKPARARARAKVDVTPTTEVSDVAGESSGQPAPPLPRREPSPRRTARGENPAAPAPEAPAAAEGALAIEARSLAGALARWRRGGEAEAALALLTEHDRRFPHGALWIESRVARAEILLGLSRKVQALAVLDSLTLTKLPRARELETLRGELRAQAGRCGEARADLERVLARTRTDELGRRAARALANCP